MRNLNEHLNNITSSQMLHQAHQYMLKLKAIANVLALLFCINLLHDREHTFALIE